MQLPYCSCVRSIQANPEYLHGQHVAHVSSSLLKAGPDARLAHPDASLRATTGHGVLNTRVKGHIWFAHPQ